MIISRSFFSFQRASRSFTKQVYVGVFFEFFFLSFFVFFSFPLFCLFGALGARLEANMAGFGAQVDPQNGAKIEVFRGPRGDLS